MLWGYSIEQLQAGAAAQLVKYLDSEDLDFRVLSFWNLNRIAGARAHYYRPEFTAVKRATRRPCLETEARQRAAHSQIDRRQAVKQMAECWNRGMTSPEQRCALSK